MVAKLGCCTADTSRLCAGEIQCYRGICGETLSNHIRNEDFLMMSDRKENIAHRVETSAL